MKYDYKKALKTLLNPPANPVLIQAPRMQFLMLEGKGSPNDNPEFDAAVSALYGCAYSIKFGRKKAGIGPEYSVQPLEGLWWVEGVHPSEYLKVSKSQWRWLLMIGQPDFITKEDLDKAKAQLLQKKGVDASAIKLDAFEEGPCVQVMYTGPYADEHPAIDRMHDWAIAQGYSLHGLHHEIYLGDPKKSAPEKLKTILRQPIQR